MKTVRINATANRVPETLSDCLSISCDECIMAEFADTITECKHREQLTKKEQHSTTLPSETVLLPTTTDSIDKRYPKTLSECDNISCSHCVAYMESSSNCEHRELMRTIEHAQINTETDPTGRTSDDPGAKLDEGKVLAGALVDFGLALTEVAKVSTHGIHKYSRGGWRSVPDGEQRYTDAMWRHLLAEGHETIDQDSGLHHAAHLAWNALARLEFMMETEL